LLALMFAFARLPKIDHAEEATPQADSESQRSVLTHPPLLLGAIGISCMWAAR
jgi:FHS family L-fucose permease-like MFS transporter